VLDEIWLPGALFQGTHRRTTREYKGPLYGLFETEFGTRMIAPEEQLRAVGADIRSRNCLELQRIHRCCCVERVSYSYGDRASKCGAVCTSPSTITIETRCRDP